MTDVGRETGYDGVRTEGGPSGVSDVSVGVRS